MIYYISLIRRRYDFCSGVITIDWRYTYCIYHHQWRLTMSSPVINKQANTQAEGYRIHGTLSWTIRQSASCCKYAEVRNVYKSIKLIEDAGEQLYRRQVDNLYTEDNLKA
jgi:hypothetical protein